LVLNCDGSVEIFANFYDVSFAKLYDVNSAPNTHAMQRAPSEPERVLWLALRAGQLGVPFRRQVVLAGFVVDFFAPAARLVVEVDGLQHRQRRGADRRRDARLAELGLRVLRLEAQLVLAQSAEAVARVAAALRGLRG
jgi:very-short-patch-repair endonuclease